MDFTLLPTRTTFGRTIAARDFGGFSLSVGVHAPHEEVPAHQHADEYQWCLVLNGGFEESAGRQRENCGAGSFVVRPPDCVHADHFAAARGICLNVFPEDAWLAKHNFDLLRDRYAHHRTRRLRRLGQALARELRTTDSSGRIAVESLVLELLSSVARLERTAHDGHPRWLAAALDRIEAEPDSDLSLDALAEDAGVSAGHLARTFRAVFGRSVGAHVRKRRLAQAEALVRHGKLPLAEVAAAAGFCDQAHFCRAFKAHYGISPTAMRGARQSSRALAAVDNA